MSLKDNLNNEIKNRYPEAISFNEIIEIAHYYKPLVKDKSVERLLNRSLSPDIITLKNNKKQIRAYIFKDPEQSNIYDFVNN